MRTPFRRNAFHELPSAAQAPSSVLEPTRDIPCAEKLIPEWICPDGDIYKADAVELLRALPDSCIDLVITDPAYESLEKWRAVGSTTRLKVSNGSSNKWFETFPNHRYFDLFNEIYRVLRPGTHVYVFLDQETRDLVCCGYSPTVEKFITQPQLYHKGFAPIAVAGLKYWKDITWDKTVKGMGYHYPAQSEKIVLLEKVIRKGKHRRLNTNLYGDVIPVKRLKGKGFYPTEKPRELLEILIKESSNKGAVVLDPFCGSGSTGQACRTTGRRFILGDIDPTEAIRRLQ